MLDRLTAGDSGGPVISNGRRPDPRPLDQPTPAPGARSPTDGLRAPGRKEGAGPSLRDHTFKVPRPHPGDPGPGGGVGGPAGSPDETDHSGGHHGSGHHGGAHHGNGHHGHHRNHFNDHRRHHHHHGLRFCFCYGQYCSYYGRYSLFYSSYYSPARYWYRYCYLPYYYPVYYGLYGSYYDDYGPLGYPSYSALDLLGYGGGGGWGTYANGGAYAGGGGVYSAELLLPNRKHAWSLLGEGQIEAAQKMFAAIVAQMPYEGEARVGYAVTTALVGDGERAVALMRRALVDDPKALYDVPPDDAVREKIELLLEAYSALVRADLANTDSLLMAASLRFILGDYPGAFFAIDASIKAGDEGESAANLHAMLRAIMFESF